MHVPGCADRQILTDEVDCDWREFGLGQSIIDSLLFYAALDVGIQHNAGQLRILKQALEREIKQNENTVHRQIWVYIWKWYLSYRGLSVAVPQRQTIM